LAAVLAPARGGSPGLDLFLIVRQEGEIIGKLGESFYDVFSVGYGENAEVCTLRKG
jgi:hypothetical protein